MAIKRSIVQCSYVELLRDMMKAFGQGVNGIAATNGMKLFEYSINMIKNLMSPYEQRGGTLFKN